MLLLIKYLIVTLLSFSAEFLAFLVAPLIVLFQSNEKLPFGFKWMETHDNDLLGDGGHQLRWADKPKYFQRVAWLWRNRAYRFSYDQLGFTVKPSHSAKFYGNPRVANRDPYVGGFLLGMIYDDQLAPLAFEFYYCKRWVGMRAIRLRFGWKIKPVFERLLDTNLVGPGEVSQVSFITDEPLQYMHVCSISPLMGTN